MSAERPALFIALQQFCEFDPAPKQLLRDAGWIIQENRLSRRLQREDLQTCLQGIDAVLAGVEPYDGPLLKTLPRLRCISRCGTGTDSIDLEAAKRLGIAVLTTPDEVVEPVAQLTLTMILSLARNVPITLRDLDAALWKKRSGFLLGEWTIGIVGYGRIGRRVQELLQPFGVRILVSDPNVPPDRVPTGVEQLPLAQLLTESDLVTLHADRRGAGSPLLGASEFALLKPGARLVNTARGTLIDEAALCEALRSGRVGAAALDVFQQEPYTGPLTKFPQVLCTPHIASLTRASRAAMELRCARNVVDFFRHRI